MIRVSELYQKDTKTIDILCRVIYNRTKNENYGTSWSSLMRQDLERR